MKKITDIVPRKPLKITHSYRFLRNRKKKLFLENYKELKGNVPLICKSCGIDTSTFYNWLSKDTNLANKIMELERDISEDIKGILVNKAYEKDLTAVIFYLKNKHPEFREKPSFMQQINASKEMSLEIIQDVV
jgi:hypothetical protein